ncbi:MAG TPA: hypothetical protein VK932_23270 [Kofleriaceae bacterium]|nr:hypothetical protein [Kofleriaceae bacterium]
MKPASIRTGLLWLCLLAAAACGAAAPPPVRLVEEWPTTPRGDYEDVTARWTRKASMRGTYQEALEVAATFKSPEWRAARAEKDADARGLEGEARAQRIAQARAEAAGPYELQLMIVTWDRRESDLERGAKSVWRVRLLDEQGFEIEPLEIVKDKRPPFIIREEFPAFGDFATAYLVRFPRTKPLLGPDVRQLRLRLSSARGGVSLIWRAP